MGISEKVIVGVARIAYSQFGNYGYIWPGS